MNGQLKVTGAHIDYVLAELLGEKPRDFLILCLHGRPLMGFGSPPDTQVNRDDWNCLVSRLNEDGAYWRKFLSQWADEITAQFGNARLTRFRPTVSYEVHRVVVGYSEHLHSAIRLFENPKVTALINKWAIDSSPNGAVACEIWNRSGGRVRISGSTNPPATEQSASLPEVIVWAVIDVLRDGQRNSQEGGR